MTISAGGKDPAMALAKKKFEFKNGLINKHEYIEDMFCFHKSLFDYPELISDSPVSKIEISKDKVIFTISNGGNNILLSCDGRDAYSLPLILLNLSETETREQSMVLKLISDKDVVFDIGANIGWYSISISLKRRGVSVYSFEPIKSSFHYLKHNLQLNQLNPDHAYNFGFSNKNELVKFYFDVRFAMASSMANLREDVNTVVEECEVKKLDDFVSSVPSLKEIDFIKCDVEGAELFVFQGAAEIIKKSKPIIFTEMLRKWAAKFNYHPNEIISFLSELGYRCFTTDGERLFPFSLMDEYTVETNYFFLHEHKHSELIKLYS